MIYICIYTHTHIYKPCFNHQTCYNSLVRSSYRTLSPARLEGYKYMMGYMYSSYRLKVNNET